MERLVLWHRAVPPQRQEDDDTGVAAVWARSVAARFQAAGGQPLGTLGSAVAAAFDASELADAVDVALGLLDDAEAQASSPAGIQCSIAVALGDIEEVCGPGGAPLGWAGSAIDRAQVLANRGRPGELVLDTTARDAAAALYLFGRSVTGAGGLKGQTIDRGQPRRATCRQFVQRLAEPPVPPIVYKALAGVGEQLTRTSRCCVLLRGPAGAGAERWVEAMESALEPPLVLRLPAVPAGLEPLGSLRAGLIARWREAAAVPRGARALGLDDRDASVLEQVARGEAVRRVDTMRALTSLIEVAEGDRCGMWFLLDPASDVDPASLHVVARAVLATEGRVAVVARLPVDATVPPALERLDPVRAVVPSLRAGDAATVAYGVLGPQSDAQVARRVGVLGGDTLIGVVEAARTLVASGDLIHDGSRFVWRVGPRSGVQAIPTAGLVAERLAALEEVPRQLLEVVCILPASGPRPWVEAVARNLERSETEIEQGLATLRDEAFTLGASALSPSSHVLREVVVEHITPARAAELHRAVARTLRALGLGESDFGRALVAYYDAEGGRVREAARAVLVAGRAAATAGFARSAVRLAAAAVQFDSSRDTRVAASGLVRMATGHPAAPRAHDQVPSEPPVYDGPRPDEGAAGLVRQAVDAMMRRDLDAVERCVDIATAEGCDRAAASRMRALAHLARGDHAQAMQLLASVQDNGDHRHRARAALTRALILLHAGDPAQAVRAGLGALSTSRRIKDPRGEAAAMHALSWCFRALGRAEDADRIEDASPD